MRAAGRLLAKYVPSIKFVGGPHQSAHHAAVVHPCAPDHLVPTGFGSSNSSSTSTNTGSSFSSIGNVEFESRNLLSKRFRYGFIDDIEIDDVNTGGAEILIR
ncbi:unnamed protein product [[Candida] boidinii]|nr:unnamed protein product [[Candida] boidinii]